MLHQENQGMIINTGSKQGITNPPYVALNLCGRENRSHIAVLFLRSSYGYMPAGPITVHSGNAAYNASKAAVKSLTESLAHELRERPNSNVTAHLFM